MSKKMTPCEKLGYKVGDMFEMTASGYGWSFGDVVKLVRDDGSIFPEFEGVTAKNSRYDDNKMFMYIGDEKVCVKRIRAKLKPAKQALADAIHQNGGWVDGAEFAWFQGNLAKRECNEIWFGNELSNPEYSPTSKSYHSHFSQVVGKVKAEKFKNWHQCILSRDEYFTAYPEQLKVEVKNETKHKVEVEMTSESEMTINASDWHKNGELPPAGTWCTLHAKENNGEEVMFIGVTSCNSPVFETVQNMIFVERGEFRFSPLRTEREKAIDEMVCEFIDHHGNPKVGERYLGIAAKLYDAGYRKEVK